MSSDQAIETGNRHVIPESLQNTVFIGGVLLGMTVFALGVAFLILGVSVGTGSPAPYVYTTTDKYLLIAGSLGTIVAGVVLVRLAARAVGW